MGGRRADEELGVPDSRDRPNLWNGQSESDLHQGDDGCGDDGRRDRVHHNAERAMISVGRVRVCVRDLSDSQESKQRQTEQSNHHGGVGPRALIEPGTCLESAEQCHFLKDTQVWMR